MRHLAVSASSRGRAPRLVQWRHRARLRMGMVGYGRDISAGVIVGSLLRPLGTAQVAADHR